MTNKEFFLETIKEEKPTFIRVLKAIPNDKLDFKPHEKARTMGQIASQLASQPFFIAAIATEGAPDWGAYGKGVTPTTIDEMVSEMEKNFVELEKKLVAFSDSEWENGAAILTYPGGKWETKKYSMAWGFLFDGIHHRGQLSAYLRIVGAKVPSVYGGSADTPPPKS